ncbi:hypothetical protein C8J56DRAFT_334765 [Mycena floridula]|nr:hypothetical protein C8J56DRAFT_334765 [Mycena floridula]
MPIKLAVNDVESSVLSQAMLFKPTFSCIFLAVTVAASAISAQKDWKHALGWDGTTSDPSSIGVPVETANKSLQTLQKRTIGGVYICTGAGFTGRCGYAVQPEGCIRLGSDWARQVQSLGPDDMTQVGIHLTSDCSGAALNLVHPGSGSLSVIGESMLSFYVSYLQNGIAPDIIIGSDI